MNIYDRLKTDHKHVIGLLNRLIATSPSDAEKWDKLVMQIRDELIPHARAEEAILYNALRDADESKSLVMHSYREHAMAESLLRSLQATDAMNMQWKAGAEKLKEALEHHIAEEEGEIFPAAQNVFSEAEAKLMGDAFERMKPAIRAKSIFGTTLDMIVNMMPERLRGSVAKYTDNDEGPQAKAS